MTQDLLETPVLFLVFNRPDTTARVFEEIRRARPARLYVAADGPRPDRPGEKEKTEEVRRIATAVDWPCEVRTLFREENLGCKYAVSGAITWFFEQEEEGIILEDDCLPHPDFFPFCAELLERYREDSRIMQISGYNPIAELLLLEDMYFFSYIDLAWGWATWRIAWEKIDLNYEHWENILNLREKPEELFHDEIIEIFKKVTKPPIRSSSWGYPWNFTKRKNSGFTIVPSSSLIENIGFGKDATHTKSKPQKFIKRKQLQNKGIYPEFVIRNSEYERVFWREWRKNRRFPRRLKRKINAFINALNQGNRKKNG